MVLKAVNLLTFWNPMLTGPYFFKLADNSVQIPAGILYLKNLGGVPVFKIMYHHEEIFISAG